MLKNDKKETQLYFTLGSGACRAVLMVAKALKVNLTLKPMDLMQREQFHPGFVKLNPHHSVPLLIDNEFTLSESRAICIYLVEKYGRNDALYPKNPKMRAAVNQLIYFDMGTLFNSYYAVYAIPFFTGTKPTEQQQETLNETIGFLEDFLKDKKFLVAYKLTIADIILFATVSTIEAFGYDFSPFPSITSWLDNLRETVPGHEQNAEGIKSMMSGSAKVEN